GPAVYAEERGHPRLRMRHQPFVVGDRERRHWLAAMEDSMVETIVEAPLEPEPRDAVEQRMREYFAMSAAAMVNSDRWPAGPLTGSPERRTDRTKRSVHHER